MARRDITWSIIVGVLAYTIARRPMRPPTRYIITRP